MVARSRSIAIWAALTLGSSLPAVAQDEAKCVAVPREKIAAQQYVMAQPLSIGAKAGVVEPERLSAALAGLKSAGFSQVELFGGTLGLAEKRHAGIVRASGVRPIASHEELDAAKWDAVLERARGTGQRFVGSAGFGEPGFRSLADTLKTAANLDWLGRAAAAKGLIFYVHNHAEEFATRHAYDADRDGKAEMLSVWEIVAAATDPRYVKFEVDVHWARKGLGFDRFDALLGLLRRYRDRIALLHVKDTGADGAIAELGRGTTDWSQVFDAAGPGIAYYIWEYDMPRDPEASARIAHAFLTCSRRR